MTSRQYQKGFIIFFLIVFLFTVSVGTLTPTKKAQAQPVVVTSDLTAIGQWIADAIKWVRESVFDRMLASAFIRASNMFVKNLARKAAEDLTAGLHGEKPRWHTENWGEYLEDAGAAASAEYLDAIASGIGLDICDPPSGINLKLGVAIAIDSGDVPKPRCSLNDIGEKWGELQKKDVYDLMALNGQSLRQLGFDGNLSEQEIKRNILKSTVNLKESDIGYVQYINEEEKKITIHKEALAELERMKQDSAKAITTPISKAIKTPAITGEEAVKDLLETTEKSTQIQTGDFWIDTSNIFFNTLVDRTLSGLMKTLFVPKNPKDDKESDDPRDPYILYGNPPSIIEQTFETIEKLSYNLNPQDVDIISEMEMDLGRSAIGRMNNKTIDADFSEVLRKAQGGQVLTLQEAIADNLIDANKWFGYVDVASKDIKQPSVAEGFSLDNIKKLVKNRVVSVGWIFAAEIIKKEKGDISGCSAQGCTLGNVIEHYGRSGTYEMDKDNDGNLETYQDEYCGWRPISAEPYYLEVNDKTDCEAVNIVGTKTEWRGWNGASNVKGKCYEYKDTSNPLDGIIDEINETQAHNQEECEGQDPTASYYYVWEAGGCMIIEKDESPLCHLVDPNTVLKAPAQQCGVEGYYSILESRESANRQEDCAEVQHCLQEDDDGKCVGGYDYCTKEENIWRFNGDLCQKQYSSCTTLIDDQGQQESYLINTLKSCPQTEVGCRDYILTKESVNNTYVWDNDANRIYFNSSVEECNDNDAGCNEFIEIERGVNLIPNSNFEINEENEGIDGWDIPDAWSSGGNEYSHEAGFNNSSAIRNGYSFGSPPANPIVRQNIIGVNPNTTYTISAFAKQHTGSDQARIVISLCDEEGDCNDTSIAEALESKTDCIINAGNHPQNVDLLFDPGVNKYEQADCYFTTNRHTRSARISLLSAADPLASIWFDNLQLELGKQANNYREYGSRSKNYFKKAPEYLACESYDLNSYNCDQEYHPCCDYVKYCPVEDLSCSAYYPSNGDPFVPAVINEEDQCVAECNNYQTFAALASYFDNLESWETNGSEAETVDTNFIPETAQDCSEPSCELFTNIDKLESGAESKEYYSAVRQCVKPDDLGVSIELYYTWEGSDTSAFQLKTWELLASNQGDTFNNAAGGYAPCINVLIGESSCEDDASINVEECDPEINLDCRTFYDENAIAHNRLLSQTIPITEECLNIRRELSNQVYKIAPSMSQTCSDTNVGCTTYKGNNSDNVRNIFKADFESGSTVGWMADIDGGGSDINLIHSSEAIHYNGSSMKVWVADDSEAIWISYNLTAAGKTIIPGKQYSLSFWAKAFGDNSSGNNFHANSTSIYTESVTLNSVFIKNAQAAVTPVSFLSFDNDLSVVSPEWLLYKYDFSDLEINEGDDVILTFKININNFAVYSYDGIYIDNIALKGLTNSFDKIKDSWQTPRVCLDNNYLGCQEYRDLNNSNLYLYQFSDLCPEENIGCTTMIDTQNSTMSGQQTFNAYCDEGSPATECSLGKHYYQNITNVYSGNEVDSTIITPADELVYIVKDDKHSCLSNNKGCQEMSVIDNDGLNQDIYLINNPDKYIPYDLYGGKEAILCLDEYQNCVSFQNSDGSKLYKIHPRNLTCQYREKDIEQNISAGFYTAEGDNCTGLLYNQDYDNFTSNIIEDWKPYDNYDQQYAALCPSEKDSCTGFIDPLDNLNFKDYIYSRLGINLNYNHPSQWQQAQWLKDSGNIESFVWNQGISYHPASGAEDYEGLNITLNSPQNLLIYRGPDYNDDIFNFNVESATTYRLSARVKLNDADSIMTFLSCKSGLDAEGYFVAEDWDTSGNDIPYAFPAIKSNYFTTDDVQDEWQYIYGLYEILPGAHYCNLAFHINGADGSEFTIADINLEKVDGDYYYLDNDSLNYDDCNSADLKEACVLFQNTSQEGLKWNHQNSYDERRLAPGDDRMPSDVNTLLKVTRDKQCAEWLTCGASLKSLDSDTGQIQDACVSLIACDELSSDKAGVCAHPFMHGKDAQPLTLEYYHQMRAKSGWADLDYSAYSIPGLYPLDSLSPMEIVHNTVTTTILGHTVVRQDDSGQPFVYKLGAGVDNYLQSAYLETNLINDNLTEKSCRLYPEIAAPFPQIDKSKIAKGNLGVGIDGNWIDFESKDANFKNANICQTGGDSLLEVDEDCECHYTKATYGSETLYFPYDYNAVPSAILKDYGGGYGNPLDLTPLKLKSKTKHLGWKGFCLDQEKSLFINNTEALDEDMQDYRCLSWYPIDLLSGEIDAYASSQEADITSGKIPENSKLCLVGEDYVTTEDRIYCGKFNDTFGCNVLFKVPAGTKVNVDYYSNNFEISDALLNGNIWLNNNDYIFEENPFPSSPDAQIIYGDNLREFDDGDYNGHHNETVSSEEHKFKSTHFNNATEITYDFQDSIKGLFSDGTMEIFVYDEDVANISFWGSDLYVNQGSGYVNVEVITYKDTGDECDGDRHYPLGCNTQDGGDKHEVWYQEHVCHGGGCSSHDHRWTKRGCAPRKYNYYIKTMDQQERYVGKCDQNCKFVDVSDDYLNHGRGCLRNIVNIVGENEYSHYYDLVTDFGSGAGFDLTACQSAASTDYGVSDDSKFDQDCLFVGTMEVFSVNDSQDHLCDDYDGIVWNNTNGIFNNAYEVLVSANMLENYYKCFAGGVRGIVDYGVGPQRTATNPDEICSQYASYDTSVYNLYWTPPFNCSGCEDGSDCDTAGCDAECCVCDATCTLQQINNLSNYSLPSCGLDCAKTCKTYVDLPGVTYNSNNFYLNWLETSDITNVSPTPTLTQIQNVCDPNHPNDVGSFSDSICVMLRSGSIISDEYNTIKYFRFDGVFDKDADDDFAFQTTYSPFSANSGSSNLRDMIYTSSRPGIPHNDGGTFKDFGIDTNQANEDLNTLKNRLGDLLVKIPNENFNEYNTPTASWLEPDWSGVYWNEATSLNPIIKQTEHDEIDGFSEGESGISINSTHQQHITALDGDLYAYLMFYAYTAPGAGTSPIQEIEIDWTGVNVDKLILKGPFKNHKHDCRRKCGGYYKDIDWTASEDNCVSDSDCVANKQCFAQTWGDDPDACEEDNQNINKDGFFSYSFIYTCDALNDYWRADCTDYNPDIEGGCCVYTPSVTVIDNWGNSTTANLGNSCVNDTCSIIVVPK
jgi:hypothetical protein